MWYAENCPRKIAPLPNPNLGGDLLGRSLQGGGNFPVTHKYIFPVNSQTL